MTGGTGFIGGNLVSELLKDSNNKVKVIVEPSYVPVFLIAKNYQKKHIKSALKLQKEIVEEHSEHTKSEEKKQALSDRLRKYLGTYLKK